MKDNIENSWAPHLGFEPLPSAQQAGILPLDHSAAFGKNKTGMGTFASLSSLILSLIADTVSLIS